MHKLEAGKDFTTCVILNKQHTDISMYLTDHGYGIGSAQN